jgi:hypothetical protein
MLIVRSNPVSYLRNERFFLGWQNGEAGGGPPQLFISKFCLHDAALLAGKCQGKHFHAQK